MSKSYDLFKEDKSGRRVFVETVIGLDQVEELLTKLAVSKARKYFIYDPTDGQFVEPFKKSA